MPTWSIVLMIFTAETFFQVLFLQRNLVHSVSRPEVVRLSNRHNVKKPGRFVTETEVKNHLRCQ